MLIARVNTIAAGYTLGTLPALTRRFLERLAGAQGILSASMSLRGPLSGSRRTSSLTVEGYTRARDEEFEVQEEFVTNDYFKTLGLIIVEGRGFGPEDMAASRKVSVINETMAAGFKGEAGSASDGRPTTT